MAEIQKNMIVLPQFIKVGDKYIHTASIAYFLPQANVAGTPQTIIYFLGGNHLIVDASVDAIETAIRGTADKNGSINGQILSPRQSST